MICWYQRNPMITFLNRWKRALLGLYPGLVEPELRLRPEMRRVAYFHFASKTVHINPVYYGHDPRTQYRASKALLTHELGHHAFTPTRSGVSALLHQVHNILEDGRVDRIWCRTPGSLGRTIRYLYRILKQHALLDTEAKADLRRSHPSVLLNGCILANWRDHLGLPLDFHFHPRNQTLWEEKILPLAKEAWQVEQPSAGRVWDIAEEVIRLLDLRTLRDLDRSVLVVLGRLETLEGAREEDEDGTLPVPIILAPGDPDPDDEEEIVDEGERREVEGLPATNEDLNRPAPSEVEGWPEIEPQPYQEFEERLCGPLHHILHVLKPRPRPEERYASEDSGRPVPRNIIFTPETPFEETIAPVLPKRVPVELRVIVDRSASMAAGRIDHGDRISLGKKEEAAILGALLIHLVCSKLGLPHEVVVTPGINSLAHLKSGERGKALIAGIRGKTGTEDMNRTLQDQGTKLVKSRAETRVLYVVHDGFPDTPDLCAATIRELRAKGVRIYGVGLELTNCDEPDPAKRCQTCEACRMRYLFGEGLILATAGEMHLHIASTLKSLRVFV